MSKRRFFTRYIDEKWLRTAHFLHGFLTALAMHFYGIGVALFMFVQFMSYEAIEYMKIRDTFYPEVLEWDMGFALGIVVLIILRLFSVL